MQNCEYICYPPLAGSVYHEVKMVGAAAYDTTYTAEAVLNNLRNKLWIPCGFVLTDESADTYNPPKAQPSKAVSATFRLMSEQGCQISIDPASESLEVLVPDFLYNVYIDSEEDAEELLKTLETLQKFKQ